MIIMMFLFVVNIYHDGDVLIVQHNLFQIDMKGRLSPDQLESLTREYHRTYGSAASNYQGWKSNVPLSAQIV